MQVFWGIFWVVMLLVGFVLLVKGADFFVDGASGIAAKLKVSTFIIGLTVVALGTSAPEAAVSIIGGVKTALGDPSGAEVIMGNVLGSNMMNILLILGIAALVCKVPVAKSSRFIEIPFLILISLLFILLGDIQGGYQWYDGLILLGLYALFMTYTILMAKRTKPVLLEEASSATVTVTGGGEAVAVERGGFKGFMDRTKAKYEELKGKTWFLIIITIFGLGMVVGGAELVVEGATYVAQDLIGLPANIVALTVVAFGTSLPELVTSVSAARKGDTGLAIGNIIGSNIANLLFVAGLGFVSTGGAGAIFTDSAIWYANLMDGYVSIIAAALLFGFSFFKGKKLGKAAGITFLIVLVGYYTYRILAACGVVPMLQIPAIFTNFPQ
ncbi:MAG: calcium/sodium antiporter [Clostridia bacterium]|nr:calcium/sodium antiporter [Clostridia bacterium]